MKNKLQKKEKKYVLKRRMRGEVEKKTPKKEMDFYDVTHNSLGFLRIFKCHI